MGGDKVLDWIYAQYVTSSLNNLLKLQDEILQPAIQTPINDYEWDFDHSDENLKMRYHHFMKRLKDNREYGVNVPTDTDVDGLEGQVYDDFSGNYDKDRYNNRARRSRKSKEMHTIPEKQKRTEENPTVLEEILKDRIMEVEIQFHRRIDETTDNNTNATPLMDLLENGSLPIIHKEQISVKSLYFKEIAPEKLYQVVDFFQKYNITQLYLGDCPLRNNLEPLKKCIRTLKALQVLDLTSLRKERKIFHSGEDLEFENATGVLQEHEDSWKIIFDEIKTNTNIKVLILAHNTFSTEAELESFKSMIESNSTITYLGLRGAQFFESPIDCSQVVSYSLVKKSNCRVAFLALRRNKAIEYLDIRNTFMSWNDKEMLFQAVAESRSLRKVLVDFVFKEEMDRALQINRTTMWRPQKFKEFEPEFKEKIVTMLIIHCKEGSSLSLLPPEILFEIFAISARIHLANMVYDNKFDAENLPKGTLYEMPANMPLGENVVVKQYPKNQKLCSKKTQKTPIAAVTQKKPVSVKLTNSLTVNAPSKPLDPACSKRETTLLDQEEWRKIEHESTNPDDFVGGDLNGNAQSLWKQFPGPTKEKVDVATSSGPKEVEPFFVTPAVSKEKIPCLKSKEAEDLNSKEAEDLKSKEAGEEEEPILKPAHVGLFSNAPHVDESSTSDFDPLFMRHLHAALKKSKVPHPIWNKKSPLPFPDNIPRSNVKKKSPTPTKQYSKKNFERTSPQREKSKEKDVSPKKADNGSAPRGLFDNTDEFKGSFSFGNNFNFTTENFCYTFTPGKFSHGDQSTFDFSNSAQQNLNRDTSNGSSSDNNEKYSFVADILKYEPYNGSTNTVTTKYEPCNSYGDDDDDDNSKSNIPDSNTNDSEK